MRKLERAALLKKLPPVTLEENEAGGDPLGNVGLSSALLALAEIDHEHEYQLCRSVAQHLLGAVHEPTPLDRGE
jgi:hypothetical protein